MADGDWATVEEWTLGQRGHHMFFRVAERLGAGRETLGLMWAVRSSGSTVHIYLWECMDEKMIGSEGRRGEAITIRSIRSTVEITLEKEDEGKVGRADDVWARDHHWICMINSCDFF